MTPAERALVEAARRATLATIDRDGRPRLVPICFVLADGILWSPLDEKPKAVDDVRSLARVRDIAERPDVTMLIDRWSEDWAELAWVRVVGRATLVEHGDVPAGIVPALRAKHPQYADHDLEHRPVLRIVIDRVSSWFASGQA